MDVHPGVPQDPLTWLSPVLQALEFLSARARRLNTEATKLEKEENNKLVMLQTHLLNLIN